MTPCRGCGSTDPGVRGLGPSYLCDPCLEKISAVVEPVARAVTIYALALEARAIAEAV